MRPFNRKQCIYCASPAATKEHVPPKALLELPFPPNLLTFQACAACNNSFSLDEQYFLVLLSQIGTCPSLTNKVVQGGCVDRTLNNSPKLDDRITNSLQLDDDGLVYINPEYPRIHRILAKIALGLYVKYYSRVPDWEVIEPLGMFPYNIKDMRPVPIFISTYTERFQSKKWKNIQKGVFSYIFVRKPGSESHLLCIMDFYSTAWGVVSIPRPNRCFRSKTLERRVQPELALDFQNTADTKI